MARYIDVDELRMKIHDKYTISYFKATKEDMQLIGIFEIINAQPTADVVEVKRGEWLDCIESGTSVAGINVSGLVGYKCSLCGRYESKKEPYCNCGAKMKEGEK